MKLLLDENVPRSVFKFLKENNFDILWIRESNRGISDERIVELDIEESRIIITYDKDFGELVFHYFMDVIAVILIRNMNDQSVEAMLLKLLNGDQADIYGYFIVIGEKHIRRRRIASL